MPNEAEAEFLAFYELYYWRHSRVASPVDLKLEFKYTISDENYAKYLAKPDNFLHLMNREVPLPQDVQPRLKPKQLELIRELVNPANKLTLSQKLKSCEVSALAYQNWLNEPLFAAVLYEETNKATNNSRSAIFKALTNEATSGNVPAMKLYLEMSGEYTPKQTLVGTETEFKQLTLKLIEILKRHVDEQTLMLITAELETVLFGDRARVTPIRRAPVELNPFKDFEP